MSVSWWTIALQAINFLVLVWLLHRFLYKPALAVMARRRELVEQAFDKARQAEQAAQAEQNGYKAKLAELDESRQTLLTRTHAEIAADRDKVLAEAHKQADALLDETKRQLVAERKSALTEMKGEVADLARAMAVRLLNQLTADPGTRPALADVALAAVSSHLDGLSQEERAALADDLGKSSEPLKVATAAELDGTARDRWQAALSERLGRSVAFDFATEPDLIGGAELRFPHAVISLTWSEQLERGRAALLADKPADDVAH